MKKILIFGTINTDSVFLVKNLPSKGQTILAKKSASFFGGKGANQAVAIGRMNLTPTLVSQIGNDANGYAAIKNLKRNNVNVDNIKITDKHPTGVANILVDENGDNLVVVDLGANKNFKASDLSDYEELIKQNDIILIQLELPVDFIFKVLEFAKKEAKITILNSSPAMKLSSEQLKYCDYIICNPTELATILELEPSEKYQDIIKRGELLQQISKSQIIIFMGKKGAVYFNKNSLQKFEGIKVNVIDSTSVEDTFLGVFAFGLACNKPIYQVIELALFAAGLSATELGAQPSIPTLDLVNIFKDSYNNKN